ncbi:MAG: zinc ribbon domain-containing protein [Candidatus Sumerlaeia bacterium]|nr:zinc ribbon domain-containing protein [Candidatus Sumerlaeia bacterium]
MPIKPAKTRFNKSEIAEILGANVRLFHRDPGFPEYLSQLTLYLVDQAYVLAGERASQLEELVQILSSVPRDTPKNENAEAQRLAIVRQLQGVNNAQQTPKPNQRLSHQLMEDNESRLESQIDEGLLSFDDSEGFEDTDSQFLGSVRQIPLNLPPSGKPNRLADFKPVMKTTKDFQELPREIRSPTPEDDYHEPKTDKLSEGQIEEIRRQTQADFAISKEKRQPTQTPGEHDSLGPEEAARLEEEKKKSLGRAQVYKVARDYRSKREEGEQCPSCGARTRGRAVCPSCGHIL